MFLKKLDGMTDKEAMEAYGIHYYTVNDLLDSQEQGKEIRKLFEKNYML